MNEFVDALRKAAKHDGYRKDINCGATADYIERLKAGAQDNRDWAESAESEMKEAKRSAEWWKNKENAIAKCWAENIVENAELEAKLKVAVEMFEEMTMLADPDTPLHTRKELYDMANKALETIQDKGDGG